MSKNTSFVLGVHFDDFVTRKISDGRFTSTSEAIRAGMRLLEEHEMKIDALRHAIDQGFSGEFKDFDINRVKQQLASKRKD
jgi:antitoxin ParD1/3/4